jgi:hypothetical protein
MMLQIFVRLWNSENRTSLVSPEKKHSPQLRQPAWGLCPAKKCQQFSMDLHIGHPMNRPPICSRREPSKIAQGKRSAALGKGKGRIIRPRGAERMLSPCVTESSGPYEAHTAPTGQKSFGRNAFPGFYPGLFSSPPYGRNCAACPAVPHLELPRNAILIAKSKCLP